ncbi:carboxypeptidase-like regulatory domain-containing protein [Sediminitomix flava]|uniref:Uncharacterized protein n=1 Tax=Sediminitomix flava TaxID=379075 RepID=A0A316A3X4_SEDFL|nr:carboxypeptidase-like regulatory domain-containing protein [Sediminitomix flava]PWJ44437.1 hypothetical protein BC781_101797 [Sediminitomix flava]
MKKLVSIISFISFILLSAYTPIDSFDKPVVLLKVTVLDETGNTQKNAKIRLYESLTDFQFDDNVVVEGTTNDKGKATFKGLAPKSYFVKAWKGNKVSPEAGLKTKKLQKNNLNKINVIISEANEMAIPKVKKEGK